ncbi:MAG: class I SAM-dependent rRNA methyltransferase [Acidobacteria bacterium]|nr:class I SAM-dependent rRNA methyltransferase [Acidobacteriota bacterium]
MSARPLFKRHSKPQPPREPHTLLNDEAAPAVIIARRAAGRLREGHLWVYRSDMETLLPTRGEAELQPGELVTLLDNRRIPLGSALYSSASQIALRKVSDKTRLTRAAYLSDLRTRTEAAIALRQTMLNEQTDSCRLLFSEADGTPGIVADKYNDLVLLQLLTQGTAQDDVREILASVFASRLNPATILERPDPRIRELEQLGMPGSTPLVATQPDMPKTATIATLNGLRFHYDANAGQKTGAFLDQRLNYAAAARYAHGRALDVCTYQGGFALHLATVCDSVTGIDQSRAALEVAEQNLALNRNQIKAGVDWWEGDAFEVLRAWEQQGERYDTIVLDPPAFAKSKRASEAAMRGYKELNLRAMKMLRPGGRLITCSCSHHVSLADFTATVASAAADAGRRVRILEIRGAAPDHPEVLTLPETIYLKCLVLSVD